MKPLAVVDVVGLTPALLSSMPRLSALAADGFSAPLGTILPAVTCSVQSTILTGALPRDHGIVGNGWYFRDLAEVGLWRQSNRLVAGEKLWEAARRRFAPEPVTCAKLFWWYNMYSTADWSVTPRPTYLADGRKLPGIYTEPHDLKLELEKALGPFPLFQFWGPGAGLASSSWIAAAAAHIWDRFRPTINLVYLPHLDYDLQRFGPSGPEARAAAAEIDRVAGELCDLYRAGGAIVVVLSEYGIADVRRPVHLNRRLREVGLLRVVETPGGELLDPGASRAFAVADHQVAHVYVADPGDLPAVKDALAGLPGLEALLDDEGKRRAGLDHPRSGELVAVASADAWFTYYYWRRDDEAPDFARTVEIHRKPGYDPAELLFDGPRAKVRAGLRLAQKKVGLRYVMDVISLDASGVKGSHGRLPARGEDGPVLLCTERSHARESIAASEVKAWLLDLMAR